MLPPEDSSVPAPATEPSDATFHHEVERLHQFTIKVRWIVVCLLWLTIGTLSLWGLRYPISLMQEHFTWAALRYGLVFNRLPALGLALCLGMTVGVLVWQSRNLVVGLPYRERKRLEQQVQRIRQQGPSHPLWRFVCRP